jgi:hypothetical protein
MFKQYSVSVINNPVCSKAVDNILLEDFIYYDKDGFELNRAEQKFYAEMNYPVHHNILNHTCWQEPWFELTDTTKLLLDHSMFLCRCNYDQEALAQLHYLSKQLPQVNFVIRTKAKWGFDFALDAVVDNNVFEVIHIEYDHNDYDYFCDRMTQFANTVLQTDWIHAADNIWKNRDQWQHLKGFAQNDWKAQFLLGWSKAEYTEKSV